MDEKTGSVAQRVVARSAANNPEASAGEIVEQRSMVSVLKKSVAWWEGQAATLRIHLQYWMIRGPYLEQRIVDLTAANTQLENTNSQLTLANMRLTHDKTVTDAVGCRLLSKYVTDIGGDGSDDDRRVRALVEVGHDWKEMGMSARDVAAVGGWCKGSDGSSLEQRLTDAVAASSVMATGLSLALTGQVRVPSTTVVRASLPVESVTVPVAAKRLGTQTLCTGGGRMTVTSVESDLSEAEPEEPVKVNAKAKRGRLKSTGLDENPKPVAGLKRKLNAAWDQLGWVDDEGIFREDDGEREGDGAGEKKSNGK
jgi:hypothetical protein